MYKFISTLAVCLSLGACAVGPDYKPVELSTGATYANAPAGSWQLAEQADLRLRQNWWEIFSDLQLNVLMQQLNANNLDIAQAQAQFVAAQASLAGTESGLWPTLDASASKTRSGQNDNTANSYNLTAGLSWELDLWGRVRRSIEADDAAMLASQADLQAVRLSMQKTLAQTYFEVRAAELQIEFLQQTLAQYQRAYDLTNNRYQAGLASSADVAAAKTQLEQARVQQIRQGWQRQQQLNAIALLLGTVPAKFHLSASNNLAQAPNVPVGIPSMLLLQRPDVAAAERRVAQANARIGIAQSAWFPDLTISAQGGYRAAELASWLTAPARFWTLGPSLALSIFDGGKRSADVRLAQANYDAQAANYRKTVLDAIREVEDYLIQAQALAHEAQAQQAALQAAKDTLRQVNNQYQAGMVDYLSVVQAQTSAFNAEQNVISLQSQQLQTAIALIAAQGGWLEPAGAIPADRE